MFKKTRDTNIHIFRTILSTSINTKKNIFIFQKEKLMLSYAQKLDF